jgi:hypothetical protein
MEKCNTCGMLRATKDLVLLENGSFMCFSCWNKELKKRRKNLKNKTENPNS